MRYYLGPLLWMGIIFVFSTDAGAVNQTNALLAPLIRFFEPEISRRDLVITLITIRKTAHVIEYLILSLLWFNALNQGKQEWSWRPVLCAMGISVLYAGLDELHQAFVNSRTSSLRDVGIDSIGAFLGQGISQCRRIPSMWAKFFAWWFAWGVVSTLLVLIVLKGGPLSFWKNLLLTLTIGLGAGMAGVIYHVRQR